MDRTKLGLVAGCLLFAGVAYARFAAAPPIEPPRPLQLMAPENARPAAPAAPAETRTNATPANAAVSVKAAAPEPRRAARVEPPAAAKVKVAAVSEVAPKPGPRISPSSATPAYERRVADAASIGAEEPGRATYRLEHIAATDPDRPEAFESLAAIHLRQGDFYQAYEMFGSAIRKGGKATFSILHDHTRGNFDKGPDDTCAGELIIQPDELIFEGADGHRFAASWAQVREAGSNRFFGSGIGGFHVRVAADGKSRNFNLAPRSRDKREANIILDLLIENAQRQDTGK
jgi:hypothetical protein